MLANRIKVIAAAVVMMFAFAGEAHAQALRKIVFANDCNRSIQLFVYSADSYHNWQPHGWYKFDPNDSYAYIRANGSPLLQLEDHDLYFYAETTDGGSVKRWQGGGPQVNYQGGIFNTMKANTWVNNDGDIAVRITCP